MKTSSQLVLLMTTAIAIALIPVSALAAGTMNNSEVWTTINGAPVIDSNGNPVRTIHYLNRTVKTIKKTSKETSSLVSMIKQTVFKVFNTEPSIELETLPVPELKALPVADPVPVIVEKEVIPDLVKDEIIAVVIKDNSKLVKEEVTLVVVDEEVESIVERTEVVTPVKPVQVEYNFNNYVASILFDTNSATLSADAAGSLTQLAMATQYAERVLSVKLFGYADSRGDYDYNMALSEKRMLSVEEFLNGQSLNVTSKFAKGETSPILGPNGEDLPLSRRVDVDIKTRHLKD
jgi:outer membrane protein OmpA-like peptidoglycan-associated protein